MKLKNKLNSETLKEDDSKIHEVDISEHDISLRKEFAFDLKEVIESFYLDKDLSDFTNYIDKIAISGNTNRKNAIINILDDLKIDYKIEGKNSENIVVSNNLKGKKLVIGAHYDSYNNVCGANDNAAACVILLNLIKNLENINKPIDFVFFDKEESGFVGSNDYIRFTSKDNIEAFINLDMCGLGTNVVLTYSNDYLLNEDPYCSIIKNCKNVVKSLPPSDYNVFINNNIPSIFIINSTDNDLSWFKECRYCNTSNLDFIKTMHKKSDTIDKFDSTGMEMIFNYLEKYLIFNDLK